MTHKFDLGLARLMDAGTSVYQREKERTTACVAACAGIPTDKLRPGIVTELIAASRLACGVVPVGGSGVYKYVDAEPLRAILRELGEP